MMLPESTKQWLGEFDYPEYTKTVRSNQELTREYLCTLGISLESDIAEFYLEYGAISATGWYELLEPRELVKSAESAQKDYGLPDHFLPLTSQEGGGVSLYDREKGHVYDFVFGDLEDMKRGTLEPVAGTFSEYLEWRRRQHAENE